MRRTFFVTSTSMMVGVLLAWQTVPAFGVDLESFEFNESQFTELDSAANTANPGNNWSIDVNDLTDSFMDGAGNYKIAKFNDLFADNFLQIDDVTSATVGSRFIVAEMSGWEFFDSVPGEGEEIRFAFLEDTTGTSGSTVAAEVRIDRNTDTEAIELRGLAVGAGSNNISNRATLNTAQSNSFTMVLEMNKTSDTYEIFYKDGSNPSQSLGTGSVSPGRNGNSMRFVINNNFGSTIDEFLSIDRVALTDANPLTDLLTLEVNRDTNVMKLINTSGAALSGLESYSITSDVGALDATGWKPITDNYDNLAGPGNGSVDLDDDWAVSSGTTSDLTESAQGGDGGDLGIGQEVILSLGSGPWIRSPTEDLRIELMFTGGVTRSANVNFVGNGGARYQLGDLNFDNSLTVADWTIFIGGSETDLSALSQAQAYQVGDLDGDGVNSIQDFSDFKTAYDEANGLGAFNAMLAGVPEPGSVFLLSFGAMCLASVRRTTRK